MAGIDNNNQNLPDRVRQLERKLDALMKGAPLRNASITEGGIRVGGNGYIRSTNWDGTGLEDPGTEGWALGGPEGIAIINTLLLRKGIVGNDALTNPLQVGMASWSELNFSVATTDQQRAATSIEVPEGFTTAIVGAWVQVGATNSRASSDFLYCSALVNGVAAREMPAQAVAGAWASSASSKVGILSGLTAGSSIPIALQTHAQGGAWVATAANRAYVEALAVFLR
jgi:hypothetical protein